MYYAQATSDQQAKGGLAQPARGGRRRTQSRGEGMAGASYFSIGGTRCQGNFSPAATTLSAGQVGADQSYQEEEATDARSKLGSPPALSTRILSLFDNS